MKKTSIILAGLCLLMGLSACPSEDADTKKDTPAKQTETKTDDHKMDDHEHKTDAVTTETKKDDTKTEVKTVKGDAVAGLKVFMKPASMCATCHKITGLEGAVGVLGPALDGLGKTAASRKAGLSAVDYIKESIETPGAHVVDGFAPAMPPALNKGMSEEEYTNLVAYLVSL